MDIQDTQTKLVFANRSMTQEKWDKVWLTPEEFEYKYGKTKEEAS
jgi:hypothetical protein